MPYQIVSTRAASRIAPSRVTDGTERTCAVATMNRSHGSLNTERGIAVYASATARSSA